MKKNYGVKKCYCGNFFVENGPYQRYCSKKCKQKVDNKSKMVKRKEKATACGEDCFNCTYSDCMLD